MKKTIRILALLLIMLLAVGLFSSCRKNGASDDPAEPAVTDGSGRDDSGSDGDGPAVTEGQNDGESSAEPDNTPDPGSDNAEGDGTSDEPASRETSGPLTEDSPAPGEDSGEGSGVGGL